MFCVGKGRKLKQRGLGDRQQMAVSQTAPTTALCSPERAVMFPSSGIAVFRVRLSYLESLEVYVTSAFLGDPSGRNSKLLHFSSWDMHHPLLVRAWRKYWWVWHF